MDSNLTNLSVCLQRIRSATLRSGLVCETLGYVQDNPVLLARATHTSATQPRRLVAAGFHGDEPAGVLAVIELLEQAEPAWLAASGASFLPLVNPTGLQDRQRYNWRGEDPNRGFPCAGTDDTGLSAEGKILYEHRARLIRLASGGFLTLHEDNDLLSEGYFYTFYQHGQGQDVTGRLRTRLRQSFSVTSQVEIAGARVENGAIHNYSDGSFEEFLFCSGAPVAICSETPGLAALRDRVNTNRAFIEAFIA